MITINSSKTIKKAGELRVSTRIEGEIRSRLSFTKGEPKRGFASLIQSIPLPLIKGKGIKGIGLRTVSVIRRKL